MPVQYESDGGGVFAAANNNNAITVPLPATRPVGSVLLLAAFCRLITAAAPTITGYTLLNTWTSGTASGGRMWLYGRIVDGTESAPSVTPVGATGTSGDIFGAGIVCYSGVDTSGGITAIFDGTPTTTDASGTTTCTYPALTISRADSMVMRMLSRYRDAADTFTPTATWNERADLGSTNRTGGQFHMQDKLATASGSQAAVTVAPSVTTASRYLAVTLALKATRPPITKSLGDTFGLTDVVTPVRVRPVAHTRSVSDSFGLTDAAIRDRYKDTVRTDGPTGYWKFDESSGNAPDSSGGGVTLGNNSTTPGAPGLITNNPATARTFAGGAFLSSPSRNYPYNTFSWEFWVKRTRTNADEIIVSQYNGGAEIHIATDGTLLLCQSMGGWISKSTGLKILDTNPHHVVVTRVGIGGAVTFYLDGVSEAGSVEANYSWDVAGWPNYSTFIGSQWGVGGFVGTLDEVAVYDKVLTPAQVQKHYAVGTGAMAYVLAPGDAFALTDARARIIGWKRSRADTFGLTDAERETRGKRISDGLALTDATARARGKKVTPTDTFGLTDAQRKARGERIADGFGLTDARKLTWTKRVADGLALTDLATPVKARNLTKPIADSFALTDAGSVTWTANRSTDEQLLLTDQATPVKTSGAQAHTRTVADGLALTDARTRTVAFKRTRTETFALTDARRATHVVVQPDGFGLTDARVRSVGYRRTRADAFGLTDARKLARTRSVADQFGLTDARTVARATRRTQADAFGLTDSEREARGKRVSDTLGLTDQQTRRINWKRTRADALALSDAATPILTKVGQHTKLVPDTFGLTDTRSRTVTWHRTQADGFGLTDARTIARAIKRTRADAFGLTDAERETRGKRVSDTLGLTDQRTRIVAWRRTRADGFALTDARVLFKGKRVTVSDGFALTDARTRSVTWHRQRSDTFGLTDARSRVVTWHRSRSDGVALSDTTTTAVAHKRQRSDTFALTDLCSAQKTTGSIHWTRTVADSITFTDTRAATHVVRLPDGLALTDGRARTVTWHRTRADTFGLTDARARAVTWHRSRADTFSLTDQAQVAKRKVRVLSDAFTFTDARARAVTWHRTRADGITFTDARARVSVRLLSDGITFTDAFTKVSQRGLTVADTFTFTDAILGVRIPVGVTLVMPYAIRPLTTQPLGAEIVYRTTRAEQVVRDTEPDGYQVGRAEPVERDTEAEGGSKLVAVP